MSKKLFAILVFVLTLLAGCGGGGSGQDSSGGQNTDGAVQTWSASKSYSVGDTVLYGNQEYRAMWVPAKSDVPGTNGPWQAVALPGAARDASRVYFAGDTATYNGVEYRAQWYSLNNIPGVDSSGVWQEVVQAPPGGATSWSASKNYSLGDIVTYKGQEYQAMWGTTPDDIPGTNGPWQTVVPSGSAWSASRVYFSGDIVTYNGSKYQAQWYTLGEIPGTTPGGPWQPPL